jgi:mutator protein MutT
VRRYPERPVVGIGAVIVEGSRVVLVQRAHEPLKGHWSLPGGAVEVGETLAEAVAREAREETGLDVRVGQLVGVFDRLHHDDDGRVEYHFVLLDYLCTPRSGTLTRASDAADARWVDIDDLTAYDLKPEAVDVIRTARALADAQAS